MKTYSKLFALGLLVSLAVSSCYNDKKENVYSNYYQTNTCDTSNVSYANDIKPIMTSYCTSGCHSGSAPAANLDLTNYNQTVSFANSIINRITTTNGGLLMPQGGPALADCDILKIETWVADGAPNN